MTDAEATVENNSTCAALSEVGMGADEHIGGGGGMNQGGPAVDSDPGATDAGGEGEDEGALNEQQFRQTTLNNTALNTLNSTAAADRVAARAAQQQQQASSSSSMQNMHQA